VDTLAIEFDRVTKVYQHRQVALADVTFDVPIGSTVGLLGANGSGKSTAIRMALGLISTTAGAVRVFGEPMHPSAKALRHRLGYLSDDPVFPKDINAIEYLTFTGKAFGLSKLDRNARMATLLRAVGLSEDAGRRIGTYSTGMKTRLGVAASLMNDPELLVWDEPTAGLDPISRMQTLDLLEKLRGNKTVILSSHILGDIDRVCDRLVVLNKGQLLFNGSRHDLENRLPQSILELRVSGNVPLFRQQIREQLGRDDLRRDGGRLRFEIRKEENVGQLMPKLIELANKTSVEIEGINSTGRRLEDAYLRLITDDEFRGFDLASNT
jgi:ABC-2 type transport system ATP-binding protein